LLPVLQLAHELVAPRRLEERVNGILLRLEKELDQADEAIGETTRLGSWLRAQQGLGFTC
jgi:hypothetical protein